MSSTIDLKQIERKAFRFTYQDGLLDILMGFMVAAMSIFVYRPAGGYSARNIIWLLLIFAVGQILFWVGKKYVTLPRMGQVRFGPARQQRKKNLAIVMVIVIFFQAGVVALTTLGWRNPAIGTRLFGNVSLEHLAVAALGSLFVGPTMLFIAYMNDFLRGYYIAILMALAVFLMIYINQPIYPLIIGGVILLPGLVLFIRFLKMYPAPHGDDING